MECPTDQALLDYFGGEARPEQLEAHVDSCSRCREVLSALAQGAESDLEETFRQPGGESGLGELLSEGTLDGKYRLDGVLGAGGMGVVLSATHLLLKQKVAIKFLRPSVGATPEARERFIDEGRLAARLKSPHVVRVMDVALSSKGRAYLVMEYLEGEDLERRLLRGLPPLAEAMRYTAQIIDALAEAHAMALIHRDLKPANLFLTPRGNETVLKVLDFGLARSVEPSQTHLGHSGSGMLVGSPLYMAPEQFRSRSQLDTRVDLWGLGCVMYRMLTGRVPFLADSLGEVVALIQRDQPPPLRQLQPSLPSELESLVTQLLDKSPERRPESIVEVARQLKPLMPEDARPLIDRITGDSMRVPQSPQGETRRKPRSWLWPLAAGCVGALAVWGLALQFIRTPEPVVSPPAPPPRPASDVWSEPEKTGGEVVHAQESAQRAEPREEVPTVPRAVDTKVRRAKPLKADAGASSIFDSRD